MLTDLGLLGSLQTNKLCAHLNTHSNANHVDKNSLKRAGYAHEHTHSASLDGDTLTFELWSIQSGLLGSWQVLAQIEIRGVANCPTSDADKDIFIKRSFRAEHIRIHKDGEASQYPVNLSGHGAMCRKLNVLSRVSDTKKKIGYSNYTFLINSFLKIASINISVGKGNTLLYLVEVQGIYENKHVDNIRLINYQLLWKRANKYNCAMFLKK